MKLIVRQPVELSAAINPGELLLFPSNLKHSVPTNLGKESRLSMSFNTFSVDTLGSEESLTHLDIRRIMNEHN